jgi:hypothetical protein
MEKREMLSKLCYYDKRNPDCNLTNKELKEHKERVTRLAKEANCDETCYCDNCFYGRTKLAEELLKTKKQVLDAFDKGYTKGWIDGINSVV